LSLLKSIAVCLVLANVAYFLWARGVAGNIPAAEPALPTLKLASESAAPQPVSLAAGNPVVSPAMGSSAAGSTAVGAAPGSAAAGSPGVGAAPGSAAAGSPGVGAAPGSAAAGSPVVGNAAPAGVAVTAGNGARTDSVRADNSAGGLVDRTRCTTVGPFRDVSEAAHAAITLRGGGYDPRQRVADGEIWAGVWVYLPLPSLRAASDEILAKLKAGGIDDALEMPGPGDVSVISLGLYSESKRAQARVAQAQALGFNPVVTDRKRTGNVYWIDIDLKPTDGPLNTADLQGESGRIMRLEVKSCPPAAGASS